MISICVCGGGGTFIAFTKKQETRTSLALEYLKTSIRNKSQNRKVKQMSSLSKLLILEIF